MAHPIVTLNQLTFSYGAHLALDDVSISIRGGVIGLLGPNGAGKTTLLKVLLGFLTPASGSARVLDQDIGIARKEIRREIGYMPESGSLIPGMDAVTLTAYLGELGGMPRQEAVKRAHEVLYYVGLEESRYRQVETYSSGMQQRLKLAQALVHDPRLLLLDEPTSGMDPTGRKEMLGLIGDIASKGEMHIIISSHLLPDIESTCDEVIILSRGRVVRQQAVADTSHARYNHFEIKVRRNREAFIDSLEKQGCRVTQGSRDILNVMLPHEKSTRMLFAMAVNQRSQIRHLRQSQTTLEDTFVDAVRSDNEN